ncbi:unnamed protein product, partial [Discosporangium mesarthrocarpum]
FSGDRWKSIGKRILNVLKTTSPPVLPRLAHMQGAGSASQLNGIHNCIPDYNATIADSGKEDRRKRAATELSCEHGFPSSICPRCDPTGRYNNVISAARWEGTPRHGRVGVAPGFGKRARGNVPVPLSGLPVVAYKDVLLPLFSGRLAKDIPKNVEDALLSQVSPIPQESIRVVPELVANPENQEIVREGLPLAALALGAATRGKMPDDLTEAVHQMVSFVCSVNSGVELIPAARATLVLIRMLVTMLYSTMGAQDSREAMIAAAAVDYAKLPEGNVSLTRVVGLMGQWAQSAGLGERQRRALVGVLRVLASYELIAQRWNAMQLQRQQSRPLQPRDMHRQPHPPTAPETSAVSAAMPPQWVTSQGGRHQPFMAAQAMPQHGIPESHPGLVTQSPQMGNTVVGLPGEHGTQDLRGGMQEQLGAAADSTNPPRVVSWSSKGPETETQGPPKADKKAAGPARGERKTGRG